MTHKIPDTKSPTQMKNVAITATLLRRCKRSNCTNCGLQKHTLPNSATLAVKNSTESLHNLRRKLTHKPVRHKCEKNRPCCSKLKRMNCQMDLQHSTLIHDATHCGQINHTDAYTAFRCAHAKNVIETPAHGDIAPTNTESTCMRARKLTNLTHHNTETKIPLQTNMGQNGLGNAPRFHPLTVSNNPNPG